MGPGLCLFAVSLVGNERFSAVYFVRRKLIGHVCV